MDSPPPGHGHDSPNIRSTAHGSVCVGTQFPAPEILHKDSGPGSVADKHLLILVGGIHGVRLSPDIPHPPNITYSETGSGYHPPHCPVVAEENVVSRHDNPRSGVPENPSRSPGCDLSADIGDSAPAAGHPPPDCLALVMEAGAQAGLPERAAAFVACSRRELTRETYNSCLTDFSVGANHTGWIPVRHLDGRGRFFFYRSFRYGPLDFHYMWI